MRPQIARSLGSGKLTGGRVVDGTACVFVISDGVAQKRPTSARNYKTVCTARSFAPLTSGYLIKKGGKIIYERY